MRIAETETFSLTWKPLDRVMITVETTGKRKELMVIEVFIVPQK